MNTIIWLRAENKSGEQRTPLTPQGAKELLALGAEVFVEKSPQRIVADQAYLEAGCQLVEPDSWPDAPDTAYILGLKELQQESFPLRHRHIYFAHAFKGQAEGPQILERFQQGGGKIWDVEFLRDDQGVRLVNTFSFWAGYVGAGLAVAGYYHTKGSDQPYPAQSSHPSKDSFIQDLRQSAKSEYPKPTALVIGALGRSGRGALQLLSELGLNATSWDMEETSAGGPFPAINDFDILINCAYLAPGTKPFLTPESLGERPRLQVVSDVSCDPNNPDNPLPIYSEVTTLKQPIVPSTVEGVFIQAVDHLPTVLPKESSEDFAAQLLTLLKELVVPNGDLTVWNRAQEFYEDACAKVLAGHSAN